MKGEEVSNLLVCSHALSPPCIPRLISLANVSISLLLNMCMDGESNTLAWGENLDTTRLFSRFCLPISVELISKDG